MIILGMQLGIKAAQFQMELTSMFGKTEKVRPILDMLGFIVNI